MAYLDPTQAEVLEWLQSLFSRLRSARFTWSSEALTPPILLSGRELA